MRNPESAASTMADVITLSKTHGSLQIEELDVSDMTSVRKFAAKIQAKHDKIHLLINNGIINS
jgi:NAD(P)-dependent dehydrogenase (short-subunit alcohol dehydrogenase family)